MKLLDTNVLVYARNRKSPFHGWAVQKISDLVDSEGAAFSAASLAELCAEDGVISSDVSSEIEDFGIGPSKPPAYAGKLIGLIATAGKSNPAKILPRCLCWIFLSERTLSCSVSNWSPMIPSGSERIFPR